AVEHLDLVSAEEQDAAVTPTLIAAVRRDGRGELEMELAIAEFVAGCDRAGPWLDDYRLFLDRPACRSSAGISPVREVLAVEQDDRVGRRAAGLLLGAGCPRGDDWRLRPVAVVDVPPAAGQHGGVLEAELRLVLGLPHAERADRNHTHHRHGEHHEYSSVHHCTFPELGLLAFGPDPRGSPGRPLYGGPLLLPSQRRPSDHR